MQNVDVGGGDSGFVQRVRCLALCARIELAYNSQNVLGHLCYHLLLRFRHSIYGGVVMANVSPEYNVNEFALASPDDRVVLTSDESLPRGSICEVLLDILFPDENACYMRKYEQPHFATLLATYVLHRNGDNATVEEYEKAARAYAVCVATKTLTWPYVSGQEPITVKMYRRLDKTYGELVTRARQHYAHLIADQATHGPGIPSTVDKRVAHWAYIGPGQFDFIDAATRILLPQHVDEACAFVEPRARGGFRVYMCARSRALHDAYVRDGFCGTPATMSESTNRFVVFLFDKCLFVTPV